MSTCQLSLPAAAIEGGDSTIEHKKLTLNVWEFSGKNNAVCTCLQFSVTLCLVSLWRDCVGHILHYTMSLALVGLRGSQESSPNHSA